jgi:hypothetical protein
MRKKKRNGWLEKGDNNPNRTARRLYHHNCGNAVGEIVSFAGPNNSNFILINRSI